MPLTATFEGYGTNPRIQCWVASGENSTVLFALEREVIEGLSYLCGIRMRFRPNRRASTDHAPGPIIASATPNAANTIGIDELLNWNKRRANSAPARNKPAMGVQRPTIKSTEQAAASNCRAMENVTAGAAGPLMNCRRGVAVTARRNSKPIPGQLSGNIEKSLCTRGPTFRLQIVERSRNPKSRIA